MGKTFDIVLTKIEEVKKRNLTSLDLNNNQLTSLPEEIGKLNNLTELCLIMNQFKVGAEVYALPLNEQIGTATIYLINKHPTHLSCNI